ncbi:MAG: hypothetical protein R3A10_00545 [Caldilineaceae bacterium]
MALRVLRLNWQPLWWDEGYSIYLPPRPAAARQPDCARHPPAALLRPAASLTGPIGAPTPVHGALLSVLIGAMLPVMAWLANVLFPGRCALHGWRRFSCSSAPSISFTAKKCACMAPGHGAGYAGDRPTLALAAATDARRRMILYVVWALAALTRSTTAHSSCWPTLWVV